MGSGQISRWISFVPSVIAKTPSLKSVTFVYLRIGMASDLGLIPPCVDSTLVWACSVSFWASVYSSMLALLAKLLASLFGLRLMLCTPGIPPPGIPLIEPLCILAGDCPSPLRGVLFGGDAPEILSPRESVFVKGCILWEKSSAFGCSVPIEVTPVSLALPALERA